MGTGAGYQIRKLIEPDLFPRNPTNKQIYSKYFPKSVNRHQICVFGFEANPMYSKALRELEASYAMLLIPVRIYTDVVCDVDNPNVTLRGDLQLKTQIEWDVGFTAVNRTENKQTLKTNLHSVDIVSWFRHMLSVVASNVEPVIVVKSDLVGNGHDAAVISSFLSAGLLCNITALYGKRVSGDWWAIIEHQLRNSSCNTAYFHLDDKYGNEFGELPLPHLINEKKYYAEGVLLRPGMSKEIFLIKNGTAHAFPNWGTFVAGGYNITDVRHIHPVEMANIPRGAPVGSS